MSDMCGHVRDLLQRQMDGESLAEHEQDIVTKHLLACASCRVFARDMQRVVALVESLPPAPAPRAFVAQVMQSVMARQPAPAWLTRLGRVWAPLAGVAGLIVLFYHAMAAQGVSLLNLPAAVAEWAALVDLNNLSSLLDATSLFAWSVGAGLLIGVSLLTIAVFAMIAQAIGEPPALTASGRRRS